MGDFVNFRKQNFFESLFRNKAGAAAAAGGAAALGGIGGSAGTIGAIGGAVAGAASSGANFVLQQAANAVKNMAIIMMLLGSFQFFLRWTIGDSHVLVFTLSLVLFVMAGYAMAESVQIDRLVVFIPMLIFCVWYFGFKANYMPTFLIYFLGVSGLVLVVIDLLTKGRAVKAELYGILPVVFLFLDIGLISFLVTDVGLPITDLTKSLVLWMPWWAFFGLMTFPLDSVQNSYINATMRFLHVVGVIYVVFVFIIPMVPTLGYDVKSLVPDVATFSEKQEQLRGQLGDSENPAWSNLVCAYQAFSNIGGEFSINECVAERQLNSKIEKQCEEEGYSPGSSAFEICVEDELDAIEEGARTAGETSSKLDQHVDIEISKSSYFDDEINAQVGRYEAVQFPIDVRIENPNEEEFLIDFDCNFISKDKKKDDIGGVVDHAIFNNNGELLVTESDQYTFLCVPIEDLNGSYSINFSTKFEMETVSYLKRAFVEDYNEQDEFQRDAINGFLAGDGTAYSADEFARINFAVGQPSENPIIELDDYPLLVTDIVNIGKGSIEHVDSYDIIFDGLEVEGDLDDCAFGRDVAFEEGNKLGDSILVGSCYMKIDNSIEDEVEDFGISFRIFEARVSYDYILQQQIPVEVKLR